MKRLTVALLLGLLAGHIRPAMAEEQLVSIYRGVHFVCDTDMQVEEYVDLLSVSNDRELAKKSVNERYGSNVCGPLAITYIDRESVKTITMPGQSAIVEVHKLQILSIADMTTGEILPVTVVLYQYTPFWVPKRLLGRSI